MLNISQLESGALMVKADIDGIDHLNDYWGERTSLAMWAELLESHSCNGSYALVAPEDIGALTDSPIIAESVTYEDDGMATVEGQVWWFPDYAVRNELQELRDGQTVVFVKA